MNPPPTGCEPAAAVRADDADETGQVEEADNADEVGVTGPEQPADTLVEGRRVGGPSSRPAASRWPSRLPRLTLRARMALLAGVAVAAAVAVVVSVALGVTRIVLNQAIDDQLLEQAKASAGNLQASQISVRALNFGMELQFLDGDGVPLESAFPSLETFAIPVDAADAEVARGLRGKNLRTVTVEGQRYRVATVPLRYPPPLTGTGALQLARSTSDVDRTLRDLGLVLFIVGLVGVVGSVIAGRLVARASLKPVDAAAAAAEEVARTQDLSALIPVTGSDEIARLATSLNSMLRALEASRLRQRQLVDDAAHELRTPLTSLRTNIELLMRAETTPNRALPAADRDALLRDVDAQMRELTALVNELIELARDEVPTEEIERLDLAQVVRAAADRARRRANTKGIRIEVSVEPSLVDGRPSLLERAVTNLLDNAVKFSPQSSTVRVVSRAGEVTVADEGPGIAPADRARVFERFYRATAARSLPGSGLGLAIVADAAAMHGGTAEAAESPSGGALLRMTLPCVAAWERGVPWDGDDPVGYGGFVSDGGTAGANGSLSVGGPPPMGGPLPMGGFAPAGGAAPVGVSPTRSGPAAAAADAAADADSPWRRPAGGSAAAAEAEQAVAERAEPAEQPAEQTAERAAGRKAGGAGAGGPATAPGVGAERPGGRPTVRPGQRAGSGP
ncbi:HAMP domain-containing sensor histidine kinase [Parafrankia sp. FMc6]|uniref:sensor histidine kinase n=1 Tax=Parafrankia soli TaxID=2599596 RepID=UPI0034D7B42A